MNMLNQKARQLKQGAIRAMFDRAAGMEGVISLGIGEPDMPTPALICQAGAEALERGDTHYTPNAGTVELRRAIAEKSYLAPLGYDPAGEIIVTCGGMGALSLLFLVLLEEGDEVLIQDPQWLNHAAQVRYCGGVPVRVPTGAATGFAMEREAVERLATARTKAILINSPNNPTGAVMSREALEEIAAVARERDLLVISDEVYSTLLYGQASHISIASLPGMRERTVVVNSFSKAYAMTGWRVGYAAGPAEIIDRMVKCQENFSACVNAPGQHAAAVALEHPELAAGLRDIFARRREALLSELARIPGIRCAPPAGAFYAFADISAFGMSSEAFCRQLLEQERVVCIPGSAFGQCGEGYIRIGYAAGEDRLREAVRRMARFCESRDNQSR